MELLAGEVSGIPMLLVHHPGELLIPGPQQDVLSLAGEMMGEHGLWWKCTYYESSARVPLIVSWPRRFEPGRRTAITSLVDLTRTVIDLAGCEVDDTDLDGRVLTDLLDGAGSDDVSDAFWNACHGGRRDTAAYLLERGADPHRTPAWEPLTPLQAAQRSGADDVVAWLRATLSGTP